MSVAQLQREAASFLGSRKFKLLSSNSKIEKNDKLGQFLSAGLSLSPKTSGGYGDVCEFSVPACVATCVLKYAGRTRMPNVQAAAARRTRLLFEAPQIFWPLLHAELDELASNAQSTGLRALFRPDTASDVIGSIQLAKDHADIVFYGYTKSQRKTRQFADGEFPANWELTYSFTGARHGEKKFCEQQLNRGANVAVVFDTVYNPSHHKVGKLPQTWFGRQVIDGDLHDVRLREIDGRGVVVGLRYKGSRVDKRYTFARSEGFIVSAPDCGLENWEQWIS